MRYAWIVLLCSLASTAAALSQQKQAGPPAATSTVSGHVYCADTNAPARMASVILQPADAVDSMNPSEPQNINSRGEVGQTLLDGSFIIHNVDPGTYYVIASKPGYVSPVDSMFVSPGDDAASTQPTRKKAPVSAPRITVQGNLPVAVNVVIERGAAVNGTIEYDDGSPASGIEVRLLTKLKDEWNSVWSIDPVGASSFVAHTDDQGHYRLSGLPPGKYLLQAQLQLTKITYTRDEHGGSTSGGSGYSFNIYSGNAVRQKDAVPFSLTPGEERSGIDIQIPVSKLHTVRGNIIAAHDGHVLNGGSLQLLYADDKSEAGSTSLSDGDDTFTFSFVPEGDYILSVWGPSDNEYREIRNMPGSWPPTRTEPHLLRQYGHAEQRIHVTGDLSGLTIAVPEMPPPRLPQAQ